MYLTEYQKITVENFMGLWARGSLDDIPPDHASDSHNMAFARKREVVTRQGAGLGRITTSRVERQFIAAFNNTVLIPLHVDTLGNIWRDDTNTIILHIDGMVDADFLNMGNHLFIAPMLEPGTPLSPANQIQVFDLSSDGTTLTGRPAAGSGPAVGLSVQNVLPLTGGFLPPGFYGVAYSFVYGATGFVTAPSPVSVVLVGDTTTQQPNTTPYTQTGNVPGTDVSYSSLTSVAAFGGGAEGAIQVNGIPLDQPPGVTAFIIWITQVFNASQSQVTPPAVPTILVSGLQALQNAQTGQLFQYSDDNIPGQIDVGSYHGQVFNLNVNPTAFTTTADQLPVNGDITNALPFLPGSFGIGSMALIKYHNRMIIIGTGYTLTPDATQPSGFRTIPYNDDRIWISNAGQPETFSSLTGFLPIQGEFDGNIPRTGFELFGVLYICKAIGIFGTTDSGSEPSDPTNPWIVSMIDGGIGSYNHGIGTISGSQHGLSFNSTAFLANRNGLFLFNGNVLRPELTWKIRAVWERMGHGSNFEPLIRVAVDIYNDILYVLLPVPDGDPAFPFIFLMGDYSLGLDYQNIRWSTYNFPWLVTDIMMGEYPGDLTGPYDYFLRLGTSNAIYKLDGVLGEPNADTGTQLQGLAPQAIDGYYQCAPMAYDAGSLNLFRFIRYRMAGAGTLITTVTDQGDINMQTETPVSPLGFPGNYKDIGLQINFTNEKAMLRFETNAVTDWVRMARLDMFGKIRWPTRPNG